MLLIRNSSGEISLYTGKLRHPMREQAYVEYFDSASFIQVTDDWYNSIPAGKAFLGSVNLGGESLPDQDGHDVIE